jgi:hypothetical protein
MSNLMSKCAMRAKQELILLGFTNTKVLLGTNNMITELFSLSRYILKELLIFSINKYKFNDQQNNFFIKMFFKE